MVPNFVSIGIMVSELHEFKKKKKQKNMNKMGKILLTVTQTLRSFGGMFGTYKNIVYFSWVLQYRVIKSRT